MAQLDYKVTRHSLGTLSQEDIGKDAVMVRSEATLASLPEYFKIGTIFYTAGFAKMWHKDLDGGYTPMGEVAEG